MCGAVSGLRLSSLSLCLLTANDGKREQARLAASLTSHHTHERCTSPPEHLLPSRRRRGRSRISRLALPLTRAPWASEASSSRAQVLCLLWRLHCESQLSPALCQGGPSIPARLARSTPCIDHTSGERQHHPSHSLRQHKGRGDSYKALTMSVHDIRPAADGVATPSIATLRRNNRPNSEGPLKKLLAANRGVSFPASLSSCTLPLSPTRPPRCSLALHLAFPTSPRPYLHMAGLSVTSPPRKS